MDRIQPIFEAFDYLDMAFAVSGAVIVALWFGRGKGPWGILSGAVMGGLLKPLLLLLLASGVLVGLQTTPAAQQTPQQQDETLKFWTK